jgi:hypothetical protein
MAILDQLIKEITPTPPIMKDPSGGTTGSFQWGILKEGAAKPQNFVYNTALILIWALGILAVITFIIAGVRYITAGGDAEKAESAKKIIIGSVIGMLLVLGSYLIFNTAVSVLSQQNAVQTQSDIDRTLNQTF